MEFITFLSCLSYRHKEVNRWYVQPRVLIVLPGSPSWEVSYLVRKQKKLWHRCTLTGHWTTQGPRALRVPTAAVVSGWLIGWLYVVVGWYVAGKKNIKSTSTSYTCLCFMFLYRQYCNSLIWESIKLEIGWFLISLCCICRTTYKGPGWQIQLEFFIVWWLTQDIYLTRTPLNEK